MTCPCGSTRSLAECCEPYISGDLAPTPEALMRSRFTAFTLVNIDYLNETTDPQTRLDFDVEATRVWAEGSEFFKLEVLRAEDQGNKGLVEFKAHFRSRAGGEDQVHHELSKFRKQAGRWYFREGRMVR